MRVHSSEFRTSKSNMKQNLDTLFASKCNKKSIFSPISVALAQTKLTYIHTSKVSRFCSIFDNEVRNSDEWALIMIINKR